MWAFAHVIGNCLVIARYLDLCNQLSVWPVRPLAFLGVLAVAANLTATKDLDDKVYLLDSLGKFEHQGDATAVANQWFEMFEKRVMVIPENGGPW